MTPIGFTQAPGPPRFLTVLLEVPLQPHQSRAVILSHLPSQRVMGVKDVRTKERHARGGIVVNWTTGRRGGRDTLGHCWLWKHHLEGGGGSGLLSRGSMIAQNPPVNVGICSRSTESILTRLFSIN